MIRLLCVVIGLPRGGYCQPALASCQVSEEKDIVQWKTLLLSMLNLSVCARCSAFEVDSVVTQMINPEGNDILAMLVGSLAPCVSAPWWEEVRNSTGTGWGLAVQCTCSSWSPSFLPSLPSGALSRLPSSCPLFILSSWCGDFCQVSKAGGHDEVT